MSDDELRKLIPALPVPHHKVKPGEVYNRTTEEMERRVLATARAVWAAAIEEAMLAVGMRMRDCGVSDGDIGYYLAAIRSIGSREQSSRTSSSEGEQI